jgi:hypothetical protein
MQLIASISIFRLILGHRTALSKLLAPSILDIKEHSTVAIEARFSTATDKVE